jgi:phospholipase C
MVRLAIVNNGTVTATVRVACATGRPAVHPVPAGATVTSDREAAFDARGWYDIIATVDGDPAYRRRFAGHVEYGAQSVTG